MIYSLYTGLSEMGSWADEKQGCGYQELALAGTEQPELLDQWCYTSPLHRGAYGGIFIEYSGYSNNVLKSSKETKQEVFLLLHQNLNKESKPWEPSEICTEQDTQVSQGGTPV